MPYEMKFSINLCNLMRSTRIIIDTVNPRYIDTSYIDNFAFDLFSDGSIYEIPFRYIDKFYVITQNSYPDGCQYIEGCL